MKPETDDELYEIWSEEKGYSSDLVGDDYIKAYLEGQDFSDEPFEEFLTDGDKLCIKFRQNQQRLKELFEKSAQIKQAKKTVRYHKASAVVQALVGVLCLVASALNIACTVSKSQEIVDVQTEISTTLDASQTAQLEERLAYLEQSRKTCAAYALLDGAFAGMNGVIAAEQAKRSREAKEKLDSALKEREI